MEIQLTIDFLEQRGEHMINENEIVVLITGIGGVSTAFFLAFSMNEFRPDYVIQAGIGGSFSTEYPPGNLVLIKEEVNGDLGVEEDGVFKDVFDLGLQQSSEKPYTNKMLVNPHCDHWSDYNLPVVRGVTINEITSSASRIQQLQQKYQPIVESMEGAAMHYSCLLQDVPFIQLRAISNFVGERDKSKWKMREAINALNEKLVEIIQRDWDFLPNNA